MDPSDMHPDLLGEALSQSGQRLAQLGSLLTSWAMVQARRTERQQVAQAARNEQELRELRDQERAARELARAGWAPAQDRRWLNQAGLVEVARAWSAAAAYADDDPGAAAALGRCEDRLRQLHPYAMAWYDRVRSQGAGRFDAMQDALPLFARAPHARPGGPGIVRPALAAARPAAGAGAGQPRGDRGGDARMTPAPGGGDVRGPVAVRSVADLAAENFPRTATDAVHASVSDSLHSAARPRVVVTQPATPPSRTP